MNYTRLYRSSESKVIGGVCGGLGEYFAVDPNLVRVIAVVLFLASQGFALVAYVAGWIIIPRRPIEGATVEVPPQREYSSWTRYLPGLILIFIGAILLVREHWFWFDFHEWWPALLVVVGLFLLLRRRNQPESVHPADETHRESQARNGGTVS